MSDKKNLQNAAKAKNDEFYTQLVDIENELRHYKEHFKGKIVLCNCDDPRISNFFHYFAYNFKELELKKLITTCYKNQNRDLFSKNDSESAIWLEYNGETDGGRVPTVEQIGVHKFKGDGDFRSKECRELLNQADIVCTNPPFSLFREYMALLMKYNKKFIIMGNMNNITYKEIYPLISTNKIWLGYHCGHTLFAVPEYYKIPDSYDLSDKKRLRANGYIIDENGKLWRNLGNICWYTNLDIKKRHEDLILTEIYKGNEDKYPHFDNYNGINVKRYNDIPMDYEGVMGVPTSFLVNYNPEQFEIVGFRKGDDGRDLTINGKSPFFRILIRNKNPQKI